MMGVGHRLRDDQQRLPVWLKSSVSPEGHFKQVEKRLRDNHLHSVCQSARCPNRNECWSLGTATFLILGNLCTRTCRFCSVPKGQPSGLDRNEPERVAAAVAALRLSHVVVTSVTRDDLQDGGAAIFADTIRAIRRTNPGCRVEVLIPDLGGSEGSLKIVNEANPDILGHNLETVPSLYPAVRPQAVYKRSLQLLERGKQSGMITKSGLMVGLGERRDELSSVMRDLRSVGCDIVTIGQYLRPGRGYFPVKKYYHPDEFAVLRQEAFSLGFRSVVTGPLVRSSYRAGQYNINNMTGSNHV